MWIEANSTEGNVVSSELHPSESSFFDRLTPIEELHSLSSNAVHTNKNADLKHMSDVAL
jgi:hypothetical protein